jgi:hypothetical protein
VSSQILSGNQLVPNALNDLFRHQTPHCQL